jgi:glycine C-acetyltransferase
MLVLLMVFVCTWKRFTYRHNDLASMEKNLERATKLAEVTGGGILLLLKVFWNARSAR